MKKSLQITLALATAIASLAMTGCASTTRGRDAGEVISDTTILTRLKAAYMNDPEIKSNTFKTGVDRGTVYLDGEVRSEHERQKAQETALGIKGVKAVSNNLKVNADAQPAK